MSLVGILTHQKWFPRSTSLIARYNATLIGIHRSLALIGLYPSSLKHV
jgi:hypothetical protein